MPTRTPTLTLFAATLALGLGLAHTALAEPSATPHRMTIAQTEGAQTEGTQSEGAGSESTDPETAAPDNPAPEGEVPPDPSTLTNPDDKHAVTPAEVAECMKSWDPQTGMSKEGYEKSCKSTLKYFPEGPN